MISVLRESCHVITPFYLVYWSIKIQSQYLQVIDNVKNWMKGDLSQTLHKSIFLRDIWNKRDGVFAEMQISRYSFIVLNVFRWLCTWERYWYWKSNCIFRTNSSDKKYSLINILVDSVSLFFLYHSSSSTVSKPISTNGKRNR